MNSKRIRTIAGWGLFLFAAGFFVLQMGYLYLHANFQVEYTDNRLFYVINMVIAISHEGAVFFLFCIGKRWKSAGSAFIIVFIILNGIVLVLHQNQIKNITSISPDFKHVLSIKENTETNEAVYYRTKFWIFARPKDYLQYETDRTFKVKWLENDVAAVTYGVQGGRIHQYVGTYGDRGSGMSYYYVAPSIQGIWQGDNKKVISDAEGISVEYDGVTEHFNWENIIQYGTLAVVLVENDEAKWTISLNQNFRVNSVPLAGEITLYEATMEENDPVVMYYQGSN